MKMESSLLLEGESIDRKVEETEEKLSKLKSQEEYKLRSEVNELLKNKN